MQVLDGRLEARHRLGDLLRIRKEPQAKQLVAAVQAEEAVDQPEVAPHQACLVGICEEAPVEMVAWVLSWIRSDLRPIVGLEAVVWALPWTRKNLRAIVGLTRCALHWRSGLCSLTKY